MPRGRRTAATAGDHDSIPRDSIDALIASWNEQRPDLDFSPLHVVARLARVRSHFDAELDGVYAAHALEPPTFGLLVIVARLGGADGVPEARLTAELGLTKATIGERLGRLEAAGLVERRAGAVVLTAPGRQCFERVVPDHLRTERRLLAALSGPEEELLGTLLRKLLASFEGSRPPAGAAPALGLTLFPAHAAAELREVVGLPPALGLLVHAVEPGSAAAEVGLRTGDVLVQAGGRELRSVAGLYAALADAAGSGRLRLTLVRGTDERRITLALPDGAAPDGAAASSTGRAGGGEHVV